MGHLGEFRNAGYGAPGGWKMGVLDRAEPGFGSERRGVVTGFVIWGGFFWLCEAGSLTRKESIRIVIILNILGIISNAIFLSFFYRFKRLRLWK